ncbi:proton-conducting transporter membrane subunit [Leifsonia sp. fls2-241-R2A-40a]|uniref:proton-conducting transporter transmembrane domain-containing protein n=1 Tax=Leifsonia sp. fls2-241-R2A-40a TaxID=3040290 RepID=UPI00255081FF|nr:proton-conducting transporter membrane subunit [Leifsonia sp. fls2-241-R2A-40a]
MIVAGIALPVWLLGAAVAAVPWVGAATSARAAVAIGAVGILAAAVLLVLQGTGDIRVGWFAAIGAVFVAGLSVSIQRFSVAHLRADTGQRWFVVWVNVLTAATIGVVLSPSVLWFAVAWTAAGAALLLLLATYPESRQARQGLARTAGQLAAGDVALWLASAALMTSGGGDVAWSRLGTVTGALPGWAAVTVALLLVVAGASRAAQVPFHTWLPVTLAAPTPVSAIMHAGLVNAAAFLVIRFSDALTASLAATILLAVCGAASMLSGAAGYLVRPDLKGRLVASTTAQMGFMLVTLSVGAWGAAVFHLMGHGIYKATLFLRAGDHIDDKRRAQAVPLPAPASALQRATAAAVATVVPGLGIAAAVLLFPVPVTISALLLAAYGWTTLAVLLYGVLTLGGWPGWARIAAAPVAAATAAVYFAAVHAFDLLVSSDVPPALLPVPGWAVLVPLLLAAAMSLLLRLRAGHAARAYGWLTFIAGSPVPRLRPRRTSRPTSPLTPNPVQEIA